MKASNILFKHVYTYTHTKRTFVSYLYRKKIPERGCGHLQMQPHMHTNEHICGRTHPVQLAGF